MRDIEALKSGVAVRVREHLPGITPSHMCSRCPTFFCLGDRFYLTALHDQPIHGIAVWPHGGARVRIEPRGQRLVFVFGDSTWMMLGEGDLQMMLADFFGRDERQEMVAWSRRRGFSVGLTPNGTRTVRLRVSPPGPHFLLAVAKSWSRANRVRTRDQMVASLAHIDIEPLVLGSAGVPI